MLAKIPSVALLLLCIQGIVFSQATIHNPNLGDDRFCKDADKGTSEVQGSPAVFSASQEVYFRVEVRKVQSPPKDPIRAVCQFFYSLDGVNFNTIGAPFTAREGKWVGAKVGLFSTGKKGTYADFDWFRIEEL